MEKPPLSALISRHVNAYMLNENVIKPLRVMTVTKEHIQTEDYGLYENPGEFNSFAKVKQYGLEHFDMLYIKNESDYEN